MTRAQAAALDARDPLAPCRARFALPEGGAIYLDGNSLGMLPRATPERLRTVVEGEWGQGLIGSWTSAGWMDLPVRVAARIAPLIGAEPHEVMVADSTSVNLFKLAAAAVKARRPRRVILSEPGNFPTDLYVLQELAALIPGLELRTVAADEIEGALGEEVALLLLTHVHYRTGAVHDMARLSAAARRAGAISLWDLSHSAGALDLDLRGAGADLAVGCGYKYLNGGPGAPSFLYVAERLQAELSNPVAGWMGHAAPFAFEDGYRPCGSMRRWLAGTPPILGLAALEEGVRTFEGVSMAEVRAKSMRLSELFLDEVEARLPGVFARACPRDPARRGSQVSLAHPDGYAIVQALIAEGVTGDFREPDVLRFGFAPLYTRYVDVIDAVDRLAEVMAQGRWREPAFALRKVVT